jgi:hypothetical protein
MISASQTIKSLSTILRYNKVQWTTGNPYNVRWQYTFKHAYYTYPKDNFEATRVKKPEETPAARPPFYNVFQDLIFRAVPTLRVYYERSSRYQDPFQLYTLPGLSIFFYQFYDLNIGFKMFTILPMMLFYTRIRDKTLDPVLQENYLRDIIHQNPEIGPLFNPLSIHVMDYDFEYD